MYEDSGPATNATAAADAAGGAGDESRFPESVLITWVPDDWTLTPGPCLPWLSQQNSLSKMMEGNGSRSEDCRSASSPCSCDVRNWSACDTKSSGYWKNAP